MSDNEGPVMTDNAGTINDDIHDGDNKPLRSFGGDRRPRNNSGRCYNCGQLGHLSYDCRKGMSGGGNGSIFRRSNQRCYNCQREGHISRDCNFPPGAKACYNCGMGGHISRDCSEPRKEPRAKNCFNCNEIGHLAAQCPNRS